MRHAILIAAALSCCTFAQAETIAQVLERSQRMRLEMRSPAPLQGERTARVRASFERLMSALPERPAVELRVMDGGVQAEAMLGRLLVVGDAVGDLPEPERLMLMAHELGHLVLGHWQAVAALYQRHIPGEVKPETTDPVAAVLGRDAHEQSHRHELQADAWGWAVAHRLGVELDDAMSLLMRQPVAHDTATHPATRRRLAQLRVLVARPAEPGPALSAALAADVSAAPASRRPTP
jgi:hypothetical protein